MDHISIQTAADAQAFPEAVFEFPLDWQLRENQTGIYGALVSIDGKAV